MFKRLLCYRFCEMVGPSSVWFGFFVLFGLVWFFWIDPQYLGIRALDLRYYL